VDGGSQSDLLKLIDFCLHLSLDEIDVSLTVIDLLQYVRSQVLLGTPLAVIQQVLFELFGSSQGI